MAIFVRDVDSSPLSLFQAVALVILSFPFYILSIIYPYTRHKILKVSFNSSILVVFYLNKCLHYRNYCRSLRCFTAVNRRSPTHPKNSCWHEKRTPVSSVFVCLAAAAQCFHLRSLVSEHRSSSTALQRSARSHVRPSQWTQTVFVCLGGACLASSIRAGGSVRRMDRCIDLSPCCLLAHCCIWCSTFVCFGELSMRDLFGCFVFEREYI